MHPLFESQSHQLRTLHVYVNHPLADLSKREAGISTPPAPTPEDAVPATVTAADDDDFEASFNDMVEQQPVQQEQEQPTEPQPPSHPMPPTLTKAPPQLQQLGNAPPLEAASAAPLPPSTMKKRPFPCKQCSSRDDGV